MHSGNWNKTARACHEIRGKILGIVGYGHIGSQLSVLAESMGMKVVFYDILQMMPLGMANRQGELLDVLRVADVLSLHVPETEQTKGMISYPQLAEMKDGAILINASRGSVVDLEALKEFLISGKIGGCALDVFPKEPAKNGPWSTGFEGLSNVILTPHIGGSTEEAQVAIGVEVASFMINFLEQGITLGSVNFPELTLHQKSITNNTLCQCRILNVHQNIPGVLVKINQILGKFNIEKQVCEAKGNYAYLVADVIVSIGMNDIDEIYSAVYALPESVATRILY
jgi:D-3-phosphoglycerate dehydrogenase